jgi:S-adenosyl methyltransferase
MAGIGGSGMPKLDTTRPHPARVYDYLLGGKDHFAIDRAAAEMAMRAVPTLRIAARENRAFLGRAVRYLVAEAGIRQFLDIGTGLPSACNVHEVAQGLAPECRVVYVDSDPLVLAHARALLASDPQGRTAYIQADLREPAEILADPVVRATLDFSQPVGLMLVAVLHFIRDSDDPAGIVRTLLDALPSGSYLAASHGSAEYDPAGMEAAARAFRASGVPNQFRSADEFAQIAFRGLELIEPGIVPVADWRPSTSAPRPLPAEAGFNGAVARKP